MDFGYGPDLSLSPSNHNALGTSGSERQTLCQRPRNYEESRARVNKELDFRLLSCMQLRGRVAIKGTLLTELTYTETGDWLFGKGRECRGKQNSMFPVHCTM